MMDIKVALQKARNTARFLEEKKGSIDGDIFRVLEAQIYAIRMHLEDPELGNLCTDLTGEATLISDFKEVVDSFYLFWKRLKKRMYFLSKVLLRMRGSDHGKG